MLSISTHQIFPATVTYSQTETSHSRSENKRNKSRRPYFVRYAYRPPSFLAMVLCVTLIRFFSVGAGRYSVENSYLEEKEDTCNALGEIAENTGCVFLFSQLFLVKYTIKAGTR